MIEIELRVKASSLAAILFDEFWEDPVGLWQQLYAQRKGWAS